MHPIADILYYFAATVPSGGEVSGSVGGLLFFMFIALGFSFLCSLWEAGLLSTPTAYVESEAQSGSRPALWMQKLKLNVEEPITAILTLNTIAHTVGAAGAGAQATGVFGSEWFGLISAVLTFLILAFSEIIPKTLGALYWKQLFVFNAYSIRILIFLLYPAVWAFKVMTNLLMPDEKSPTVSRNEISMMARIGTDEGTLKENENRIIRNLLNLEAVQIGDIMTPRTVVMSMQQDMTVREVVDEHQVLHYSRIPIYDNDKDDITGFVLRLDILKHAAENEYDIPLKDFRMEIHPVPESLSVSKALDEFMGRGEHIFLVIDEYGGTAGLVTLEDAVESLLGAEITDESDLVTDTRKLAQQRYMRQRALINPVRRTGTTPSTNGNTSKSSGVSVDNPSPKETA